jgi:hypothetical protein
MGSPKLNESIAIYPQFLTPQILAQKRKNLRGLNLFPPPSSKGVNSINKNARRRKK